MNSKSLMASRSSSSSLPCASFNQDYSFSVALLLARGMVSEYLTRIQEGSAMKEPSLSPRRLCLFNTKTGTALRELNFLTSILAVRMNKKIAGLLSFYKDKVYADDLNSLTILDTFDTVPNIKGLCAFSPCLEACYLALPASTTKGSALLYNVRDRHSHCEIEAHRAPLAAVVLSSKGMYIATASEQGTMVRVHLVSDATKLCNNSQG